MCLSKHSGDSLGFGLVVEDKPPEISCTRRVFCGVSRGDVQGVRTL